MAQEVRIDSKELFRCPLRSSYTGAFYCHPRVCALGRSSDAGNGVTKWYCALNAPTGSEPNCYVKKRY